MASEKGQQLGEGQERNEVGDSFPSSLAVALVFNTITSECGQQMEKGKERQTSWQFLPTSAPFHVVTTQLPREVGHVAFIPGDSVCE